MLTRTSETVEPINLAHVRPFRLGDLDVHPATRQIVRDGRSETLEPRVMQVLVALARADGAVVTRDELTDLCWDGRIVSENAINRVISRLRQIAAEFGEDVFRLETITKVGYRIVVGGGPLPEIAPSPSAPATAAPRRINRRRALGGIAAAGVAAAGGAYWLTPGQASHAPSPEAAAFYRKGVEARNQGWLDLNEQAQSYFRQAVQSDPDFAAGWAALSLSLAGQVWLKDGNEQESFAARARSAARRALALDPDLIEAHVALAFIPSEYRRWAHAQASFRRLLGGGKLDNGYAEWVLRARLSHSLGEVGRCRDALAEFRRAVALNPLHPGNGAGLIHALWAAGELNEAEAESERASARWPKHPGIWFTRLAFLTYSGRPTTAVAFASDKAGHPFVEWDGLITRRIATAQALATRAPSDVDRAVDLHMKRIGEDLDDVGASARFFAALGRIDTVFQLYEGYFFNAGRFAKPDRPPPGPLTRYDVISLFWPPMAPVWPDPRFERLVQRIGLAAYWQQTGSVPDYKSRTA